MREIAIVGMACRFPGGIDSVESLWQALQQRRVTAGPVPLDRWDTRRYVSQDESKKGKAYVEAGNFLTQDIRQMDAEFFDIPPRMAENLDPQQRLLLEVSWEAFENAGLDLTRHAGKRVGVYVGGFMLDHMVTLMMPPNRARNNASTAAGMMMTMLSNRLSHAFDLRGPSLSIDTACSSSLVAFNYACQDIWAGRCEMAMVGGSNVMTRPEYPIGMCKGQFLARDGMCKTFDARGDGYGRAEGAGMVILKTLEAARRDGDTILAVVAGAGANSDGRTPGISMPSEAAQRELAMEVCMRHGIEPTKVRYVECHGTGTGVGDPIEARSIGNVYGQGRTGDNRVVLGSIKSNIGHMEAAAGVAGVIKAVLTIQHREAPPLGNFETPHPDIPFDELGVRIGAQSIPLDPDADGDFYVAVNSFGYGGTNAHVVLRAPTPEEAAPQARAERPAAPRSAELPWMLPLSARKPAALKAMAGRLREVLERGELPLKDIVHTAAHHRAHLNHRAVAIGTDSAELITALRALEAGEKHERIVTGQQPFHGMRRPVFVLTGMGPQWWGMGQQLYRESAIYRRTVDVADQIYQRIAGHSILAEMLKPEAESRITQTAFAQPANFMVQIGLDAMLRASGVVPAAYVGHSVGEVSAAYLSGVLTLEDALRVSHHRARLQARTAGTGRMLAVGCSEEQVAPWLAELEGKVEIAAVNGPTTLTLSGDADGIERIASRLSDRGLFNRMLQVEVPYHSHLMDPILDDLQTELAGLPAHEPKVPLYSTVRGALAEVGDYAAGYWARNVRAPVRFMDAIRALLDDGHVCFVEVGPHPVLAGALRDSAKAHGKELRQIETLRRDEAERPRVERAIAAVYAQGGCELDWDVLAADGRFARLPNYPWQRETLWLETDRSTLERVSLVDRPLLGVQSHTDGWVWRNDMELDDLAYLREHVVAGAPVMPAAGYIETLLEAAGAVHPEAHGWVLRDGQIHSPLVLAPDRATDYVTVLDAATGAVVVRSIESGRTGEGLVHMTAHLMPLAAAVTASVDLAALRERLLNGGGPAEVEGFYRNLALMGLQYGPRFRTLRDILVNPGRGEVLARIELGEDEAATADQYRAHPAALDAAFQTLVGMFERSQTSYLPTGYSELRLYVPTLPARFWCHTVKVRETRRHVDCDITLIDDQGKVLGQVRALRVTASPQKLARVDKFGETVRRQALRYEWHDALRTEPKRVGHWAVVHATEQAEEATLLAQGIEAFGGTVTCKIEVGDHLALSLPELAVRVADPVDAAAALDAAGPLHGIVLMHGLTASMDGDTDRLGGRACATLVGFLQALAERAPNQRPRVYVVTRGAHAALEDDAPVDPAQAALAALVRVAHNELDGMKCSTVDLPAWPSQDDWDGLTLEVICDEPQDEVALRGDRRLVSELTERSDLVDDEVVDKVASTAGLAYKVRPAPQEDENATGRLIALPTLPLEADAIELAVEAVTLPVSSFEDSAEEGLAERWVEMVGRVHAVGSDVQDVEPGQRVWGLAPADVATHVRGPRQDFHIVPLDEKVPATAVLQRGLAEALAERMLALADLAPQSKVLVRADARSMALARVLASRGHCVTLLGEVPEGGGQTGWPHFEATAEGVDRATAERTEGLGFDAIVGPLADWQREFGLRCLANGGSVLDTAAQARPLALPAHAGALVRADLDILSRRPAALRSALAGTAARAADDAWAQDEETLVISVLDLVQEKLPMPDRDTSVTLTFDTAGATLPLARSDVLRLKDDATYLVTGGLGGFGQRTAHWLIDAGARHLVLTGRNGADTEERRAFVDGLRARGARVHVAAVDGSNRDAMQGLFDHIRGAMPPLSGIFHAAAVIIDETISEMQPASLAATLANKAEAALILHELSADLPLDHFVLFSSTAVLVGNSRQGAYVAANGFLDGLAQRRRAEGLPALSINWGVIGDVGVVARDEKLDQFLRYSGLRGMDSAEALALMGRCMVRDFPQIGLILMSNWEVWSKFEVLGGTSTRFATLIAEDSTSDSGVQEKVRSELAALPPAERFDALAALMVGIVAGALNAEAESIPLDRPVMELGVDSLMATEIQLAMGTELGIQLSVMQLLTEATMRDLVNKALEDYGLADPAAGGAAPSARAASAPAPERATA